MQYLINCEIQLDCWLIPKQVQSIFLHIFFFLRESAVNFDEFAELLDSMQMMLKPVLSTAEEWCAARLDKFSVLFAWGIHRSEPVAANYVGKRNNQNKIIIIICKSMIYISLS